MFLIYSFPVKFRETSCRSIDNSLADFALNRALKQISDYSRNLNINTGDSQNDSNPETKVAKFIQFLPVLAYDGSGMKEINASDILQIAMTGTSATMLAKRWESALLVNVDNDTLQRLQANEEAMNILMKIEEFRSLNNDITTIINKSDKIKATMTKEKELSQDEKTITKNEEKEMKSLRKQIQQKLIKFATRIPVFMYLSDYREYSLEDVIRNLESGLFQKVTGLTVKDFDKLTSLGIFNKPLMNDAVYHFKRYEDPSLEYYVDDRREDTGINQHKNEKVGLYNTVITQEEYRNLYKMQQESIS